MLILKEIISAQIPFLVSYKVSILYAVKCLRESYIVSSCGSLGQPRRFHLNQPEGLFEYISLCLGKLHDHKYAMVLWLQKQLNRKRHINQSTNLKTNRTLIPSVLLLLRPTRPTPATPLPVPNQKDLVNPQSCWLPECLARTLNSSLICWVILQVSGAVQRQDSLQGVRRTDKTTLLGRVSPLHWLSDRKQIATSHKKAPFCTSKLEKCRQK